MCGSKKNFAHRIFLGKKTVGSICIWAKKILGEKIFGLKRFIGLKKIIGSKKISVRKFLDQKIFKCLL